MADKPLFCESRGSAILARRGDWCYISWHGEQEEELYHLADDPGQLRTLTGSSPERLAEMRRVLAELAMQAAAGYRLAVVGPRREEIEVELVSEAVFAYLDVPTTRERNAVTLRQSPPRGEEAAGGEPATNRVSVRLPAGEGPQVVLFDTADPQAAITVRVLSEGRAIAAEDFHLGRQGQPSEAAPLVIGRATRALLEAEEPPVQADAADFGVWVWLPPGAAQARAAARLSAAELPEELTEQLRSLGYLR